MFGAEEVWERRGGLGGGAGGGGGVGEAEAVHQNRQVRVRLFAEDLCVCEARIRAGLRYSVLLTTRVLTNTIYMLVCAYNSCST